MISVDTKKKELVGDFKNAGREWRPQGEPEEVRVHDFLIKELGRAVPYGIYDLAANAGWVSVGMDHDTAAFAVQTIRRWWHERRRAALSRRHAPDDHRRTVAAATARACGCGSANCKRWPTSSASRSAVHHLPPGTSKWNKIEHRLFSFISHELAGQAAGQLSRHRRSDQRHHDRHRPEGALRTRHQRLSQGHHRPGREMAAINIIRAEFHGEWNYKIRPSNDLARAVDS